MVKFYLFEITLLAAKMIIAKFLLLCSSNNMDRFAAYLENTLEKTNKEENIEDTQKKILSLQNKEARICVTIYMMCMNKEIKVMDEAPIIIKLGRVEVASKEASDRIIFCNIFFFSYVWVL